MILRPLLDDRILEGNRGPTSDVRATVASILFPRGFDF
jgi:hypothetical protein